ncbi:MAG TPA: Yip1 family protein [Burkholderiales bacterium]|nr:Yip1 family protein [Burkholderiales bacterium]
MSEEGKSLTDTLMDKICRVQEILLTPFGEWSAIATEPTTLKDLYWGYIIPLAAIGPIASVFGVSFVGISGGSGVMYRLPLLPSLSMELVSYLCSLVGIFLLAVFVMLLAPAFGGQRDLIKALKLIAYSYTPAWLASFLYLAPDFALFGILFGFYGVYLLYVGLPILMSSTEDEAATAGFTVIIAICAAVVGITSDAIGTKSYGLTMSSFRKQVEQIQRTMGPEAAQPREVAKPQERARSTDRTRAVEQPPPRRTQPGDQTYEVPEIPEEIPHFMRR